MLVLVHIGNGDFHKKKRKAINCYHQGDKSISHRRTFPQTPSIPDSFSFLFLLLTGRLSLNYPAAVLIVWILGGEQWGGYSIKWVGEDVASTGCEMHKHTHVMYFWFLQTVQNNDLMSKNVNDFLLFLKCMPRKYSAKEAAHKPWESRNALHVYNNILQLQEVGSGREQQIKWLWIAWIIHTKLYHWFTYSAHS